MGNQIRSVMTEAPVVLPSDQSIEEAARTMRDRDIGDVLISKDGNLCGLVTDRDIVVRGVAEGRLDVKLEDVCTRQLFGVDPDADIQDAIEIMEKHSVRRLPVLENGEPIGMVSLGDLSKVSDADPALTEISSAPPNN
jgi:CBS domain-containing protein